MKSLERQLQVNLAITLIAVMALIWVIGIQLPRNLPDEQVLLLQGYKVRLHGCGQWLHTTVDPSPAPFQMAVPDSGGWRH